MGIIIVHNHFLPLSGPFLVVVNEVLSQFGIYQPHLLFSDDQSINTLQ